MSESCLIVGAGPVGLTLANLLTKYGVSYRIIDQNLEPVIQTKAAGLWSRTLEALHHLGLDEIFLQTAHRSYFAHIFSGGQERVLMDLAKVPSTYNFVTLIGQHQTEALLTESLKAQGVTIERGMRLTALDGNQATIESIADGTTSTSSFAYILGSDGAHSRVRKEIGASFEGETVQGAWAVGDLVAEGEGFPKDEVSIFIGPAGPFAFFALGNGRYRVAAQAGEPVEPLTIDWFQAAADSRLPFPVKLSDGHHMWNFSINERQADKYSNGTAFIMGDAAHVHSPAGGQGVNTGMQDAFNLAWKLAQVILWKASPTLLDSYQQERHPVAHRVIAASSVALTMMTTTNPIARKVQQTAMGLLGNVDAVQSRIREGMSEVDIHYPDSPLNVGKGSKTLKPGDRVPDVYWRDAKSKEHRLHDLFTGLHWTLLSRDSDAALSGFAQERLRQVRITLTGESSAATISDPARVLAASCGLEVGGHLLVRPDGYLAGYFSSGQEEALRSYWSQHCGDSSAAPA